MALMTRISRLFQADFHAVLDSIEEPDIQLKQAVREMEFDLQQDEQALALLHHEGEQLATIISEADGKIITFDEEMDICFAAKKDALAKDLIRRKLESQTIHTEAENQLNSINKKIEVIQHRIKEHQQQLDNMRQKLELLTDEFDPYIPVPANSIRSEDIEIAFLREKQRRAES